MFERFTRPARETVTSAMAEAERLGHPHTATEHLLLALTSDGDDVGRRVLRELGVTRQAVERELRAAGERGGLSEDDARALQTLGIDLDEVRRQAEASFGPGALQRPRRRAGRARLLRGRRRQERQERQEHCRRPFTSASKQVLEVSLREAIALKHNYIGTEHLLLALVRVRGGDLAADILQALGVPPGAVRSRVLGAVRRAS
jgi:ATP-dependent Clp protease ATP-binding subunit ClpA